MEEQVKKENVRVKIYAQEGNIGYTTICTFENVETEIKKIGIGEEDSMYGENSIYGVQIVFNTEKYISDYIGNSDVYKMNYEQFKNFVDNIYLGLDIITILIGYKLSGNKEAVNKIINYNDIVWLHYVDDFDIPSAYDDYRDLGWEFIKNNR